MRAVAYSTALRFRRLLQNTAAHCLLQSTASRLGKGEFLSRERSVAIDEMSLTLLGHNRRRNRLEPFFI